MARHIQTEALPAREAGGEHPAKRKPRSPRETNHITRNVARLAAERGLTVAEVEKRAGMCPGFLSPVDGSKLRVIGIAAVAKVLGVDPQDLKFGPAGGGATA
jgi:hypothetical protein